MTHHGTKIFASLSAHLAAQGLAGHLIEFEAGVAPSSSPCIVAAVTFQSRFFDKLKRPAEPGVFAVVLTKATPGSAGGQKELIARGGVDKKKSPS